jgi:hypothetical protein
LKAFGNARLNDFKVIFMQLKYALAVFFERWMPLS